MEGDPAGRAETPEGPGAAEDVMTGGGRPRRSQRRVASGGARTPVPGRGESRFQTSPRPPTVDDAPSELDCESSFNPDRCLEDETRARQVTSSIRINPP